MPTEAIVFCAGAAGLLAITAALAYVNGYAAGVRASTVRLASLIQQPLGFPQPTPEYFANQYAAWKAAQQPTITDP